MFYILIVGIVMALASAIFWVMEFKPFLDAVRELKVPDSKNPISTFIQSLEYIVGFIQAVIKLWRLGLDILCTVWLAGAFGFSGMIGGIIGISISNVISIFLLTYSTKKKTPQTINGHEKYSEGT